ncbi:MAG: hypothetical protein UX87_C0022G0002 [Candidatus Amesbacteria bacterium GW2011_GWA1_47_16]|uniref:ROK family protein n=5 Tax=Candidatus Amesiibacteriota TaxID=1752730 RepID=A0A0G1S1Y2_9BACT|nr:MAG: hypothetical protein UX87_C0022G0002 [Candidatus Amesbacteria bacterium GW2011_GWA1_47_16]KKU63534.1 MAG: hypothetical protein UX86_C0022G0008 [Candidatus Amesbacteria bacterium GW2011_GWC1_47_15]OGC99590.1 MAG: hypothetical protein A2972_02420 [Candidatus Amesbacteria bacterium RIFCSPLOWO2_01_FULL_47_33]
MYLVFDIGGTNIRMGISGNGQSFDNVSCIKTPQIFEEGIKIIENEIKKAGGGNTIRGVTAGFAGVWDKKKTKLLTSPNLKDWEGKEIKKRLEVASGGRVILENDAALGGLGEAIAGAGRRKQTVGFLTVGTGVGGVKITDGKIETNAFGFEPGHQIIDVDGNIGYWEDFVSGRALERIYGRTPEEIADQQAWENEARLLAVGIHNLIVIWSPEMIVLSGGVMQSVPFDLLKSTLKQQMMKFKSLPEVVPGELGDKCGLFGGLELLK